LWINFWEKSMADNKDDNVPIKEREDGSVLANVGTHPEDVLEDEDKKDAEDNTEDNEEGEEGHEDTQASGDDGEDGEETEDDREKIREARREERRLKKALQKEREASAKHKISALERRNEELAKRLAAVENTAASYQFAQIDKALEDESTRIEYAKMKMMEAAQKGDAAAQVEFLEHLTESKQKLQQLQHYKKQQLEAAKAPKQNVPNVASSEIQRNATAWLKKNSWYDPQARDTDSRIAKVIDSELAADGWDPADPEYWDELDSRLSTRLPHRYAAKGGNKPRANPTASSRTAQAQGSKPGQITLSRERVQAIKEAGAWDDVERRNKMIRAYAAYDRQNKG
jgi:hypothetical protein